VAAVLAVAAVVVALLRLPDGAGPDGPRHAAPEAGCDLNAGPCRARVPGGGTLVLEITPRPLAQLEPLSVRLRTEGIDMHSGRVEVIGLNVEMGVSASDLTAAADGTWRGGISLGVCSATRMRWRATVRMETAQGPVVAPFEFATEYRPRAVILGG